MFLHQEWSTSLYCTFRVWGQDHRWIRQDPGICCCRHSADSPQTYSQHEQCGRCSEVPVYSKSMLNIKVHLSHKNWLKQCPIQKERQIHCIKMGCTAQPFQIQVNLGIKATHGIEQNGLNIELGLFYMYCTCTIWD